MARSDAATQLPGRRLDSRTVCAFCQTEMTRTQARIVVYNRGSRFVFDTIMCLVRFYKQNRQLHDELDIGKVKS